MPFPTIQPCPKCVLGEPEIRGRQSTDNVIEFVVWCPTCGAGHDRFRSLTPLDCVRSWNLWCADERRDPAAT